MAKKKAAKKKPAKKTTKTTKKTTKKTSKKAASKKAGVTMGQADVELESNSLRIKFDRPDQVLPKLLELAQHFREVDVVAEAVLEVDVLGGARARIIVSQCARSTAWQATLSELGLNPLIFRNCVASGVDSAGYVVPNFPATPGTRLIEVVAAIQGAPRK